MDHDIGPVESQAASDQPPADAPIVADGQDHEQAPSRHPHSAGDSRGRVAPGTGAHPPSHAAHHDHAHPPPSGWLDRLGAIFHAHSHEVEFDAPLEGSDEGLRVLGLSLAVLAGTAAIQLVVALRSGSAGLLADTIHNFSDALTAIPLGLAFLVGRRPADRRYTFGYGRAEDLAGVAIVGIIVISALVAFWESLQKLLHPAPLPDLGWVMGAAVVGFLGNEVVALLRIRTGRRIGSAALEADGQHAQVDGLTSLGVLLGAMAVWLGAPVADPIVGLLIAVAILFVSKDAAVAMWHRLMDAVDPAVVEKVEQVARTTEGVEGVGDLRVRWLGHHLWAELHLLVDEDVPLWRAHAVAEDARHRLFHSVPQLVEVTVHVDPCGHSGADHHATTGHHRPSSGRGTGS